MKEFYQNIPSLIDPIAFTVGSFSIRWYSLMYLAAFVTVFLLLVLRKRKGECAKIFRSGSDKPEEIILDWFIVSALGLFLGARIGYVVLYDPAYYLTHVSAILSPYDFQTGEWTGIFGMSYFGGLVGIVLASYLFCRQKHIDLRQWADFIVPAVPAGYFWGRIGNFMNGELFGRPTEKMWGMYFPGDEQFLLRHPSQLYEAFFEGVVLFAILWFFRKQIKFTGENLTRYLLGYGLFRFGVEFFREPDPGAGLIFGIVTFGQFLSSILVLVSAGLYYFGAKSYNKGEEVK